MLGLPRLAPLSPPELNGGSGKHCILAATPIQLFRRWTSLQAFYRKISRMREFLLDHYLIHDWLLSISTPLKLCSFPQK
jgi:hypothetical protein